MNAGNSIRFEFISNLKTNFKTPDFTFAIEVQRPRKSSTWN